MSDVKIFVKNYFTPEIESRTDGNVQLFKIFTAASIEITSILTFWTARRASYFLTFYHIRMCTFFRRFCIMYMFHATENKNIHREKATNDTKETEPKTTFIYLLLSGSG